MQQEPNSNFMDPKTIIAIVLVGFVWIGWQSYLKNKYPDAFNTPPTDQEQVVENGNDSTLAKSNSADGTTAPKNSLDGSADTVNSAKSENVPTQEEVEQLVVHEDTSWKIQISSFGMALKEIQLKNYTDREDQVIKVGDSSGYMPFATNLVGRRRPLVFEIRQAGSYEYIGEARVNGLEIQKKMVFDPSNYTVETDISVNGKDGDFAGIVTYLSEKIEEVESSFLLPAFNQQDVFVAHSSTTDREFIVPDQPYRGSFDQVSLFSLGTNYFASAIVDRSSVIPELNVAVDRSTQTVFGALTHPVLNNTGAFNVSYTGFVGPKDVAILEQVDAAMTEIIDFGWFSWLAVFLFSIMAWFYSIFGNYGVAIILLTILVRMAVLPFNMMSYKSMKKMQEIQPLIKSLREKYKDDPQTLNQEMMSLMKDNKVNPMGGCLPMLLQFPVFIALYRVFAQSIDLYKAPFALWISDLSLRDPYYVLPVSMAVAFYFQTKLTPTTMDPTQQKVMMFMPVIFAVFMASLPSALTLYMVVSTLFGIVQQLYFMRDRKKENLVPAKQVKA